MSFGVYNFISQMVRGGVLTRKQITGEIILQIPSLCLTSHCENIIHKSFNYSENVEQDAYYTSKCTILNKETN